MQHLTDDEVREKLTAIKGIGNWTADIYLIFVLHRIDIFPLGDLAAVAALKAVKRLPKDAAREMLLLLADQWRPFRTIATTLLWHYYLSRNSKRQGY